MLETKGVTIQFGGLKAVNNVSIHVKPGMVTGVIGPNGAGKTTLFNCISGALQPNSGQVLFQGQRIDGKLPYQINPLGISRTYQAINLFWSMTVLENVMVGMTPLIRSGFFGNLLKTPSERREEEQLQAEAMKWLEFVDLQDYASARADGLSYGQQRLLEIVRGLASKPKLLLLDEPAAGMNSREKLDLDELLKKIRGMGVTLLMIEHDMKLVMNVCDYIYVLNDGQLLSQGKPEEVQADPAVVAAYLGGDD